MKFYRAHQLLELRFYRNALKRRGNRGRSPLKGKGERRGRPAVASTVGQESQLLRVATQRRLPLAICIYQVRVGKCVQVCVCVRGSGKMGAPHLTQVCAHFKLSDHYACKSQYISHEF